MIGGTSMSLLLVLINSNGAAFVGAAIQEGGCMTVQGSAGVIFGLSTDGYYSLCNSTVFSSDCSVLEK